MARDPAPLGTWRTDAAGDRLFALRAADKEPIRPLTAAERTGPEALARAGSERADRVARAKALLAVAALVRRFHAEGPKSGDAGGRGMMTEFAPI